MNTTPKELIDARPKLLDPSAMQDLLEKTRIVSRELQAADVNSPVDYPRLARLMSDLSAANVYIVNTGGTILGHSFVSAYDCPIMDAILERALLPDQYVERLNRLRESVLNYSDHGFCAYDPKENCTYSNKHSIYVPINGSGIRLGTLILARFGCEFDTRDLVLAEYLGTVVGIEFLNERSKKIEEKGREQLVVQMAMRALSFSEVESMRCIMKDLKGREGIVVASSVADKAGVTRSVIVNALRKLSSAGIIESRSLGMKGTYIKVLRESFIDELGIKNRK